MHGSVRAVHGRLDRVEGELRDTRERVIRMDERQQNHREILDEVKQETKQHSRKSSSGWGAIAGATAGGAAAGLAEWLRRLLGGGHHG